MTESASKKRFVVREANERLFPNVWDLQSNRIVVYKHPWHECQELCDLLNKGHEATEAFEPCPYCEFEIKQPNEATEAERDV
jgi:hypothetical protein